MSKLSRGIVMLALVALSVLAVAYWHSHAVAQDREKPRAKDKEKPRDKPAAGKWEYRIIVVNHNAEEIGEKELNKLGEEGFEIAFVTSGQITRALGPANRGGGGDSTPVLHYTLKRARK